MITAFTGVPRGGKSYRMVYQLSEPKFMEKKRMVFHNIDGLKDTAFSFPCVNWASKWSPEVFLSRSFQERLTKRVKEKTGRNILIIIDEGHNILNKVNSDTLKYLSWHGHTGADIWLCTQSLKMIHRDYQPLVEIECRAKKGIVSDQFLYSWYSGGLRYSFDRIPKKPSIYSLYKSFEIGGSSSAKGKLTKWMALASVFAICCFVYAIYFAVPAMFGVKDVSASIPEKKVLSSKPVDSVHGHKEEARKLVEKIVVSQPKTLAQLRSEAMEFSKDKVVLNFRFSGSYGDDVLLESPSGFVWVSKYYPGAKLLEVKDNEAFIDFRGVGVLSFRSDMNIDRFREGGTDVRSTAPSETKINIPNPPILKTTAVSEPLPVSAGTNRHFNVGK